MPYTGRIYHTKQHGGYKTAMRKTKKLRQVRAGRLCFDVLYPAPLPSDTPKARAAKMKATTAARQKINFRTSWQRLELQVAANFGPRDYVVSLTYAPGHLPPNKEAARKPMRRFMADMRAARRREGEELRYIYNIEGLHGCDDPLMDKRIHHHVVINGAGRSLSEIKAELEDHWPWGMIYIEPLDLYHLEELAKYLTKEPRELGHPEVGKKSWVSSRNLKKPETPPAEWVPENLTLTAPPGAHMLSSETIKTDYGDFVYLKYLLPEPAEERSYIILPPTSATRKKE